MTTSIKSDHRLLVVESDSEYRRDIERIFYSADGLVRTEKYYAEYSMADNLLDCNFELEFCSFGLDAVDQVSIAKAAGDPFKVIFIDISQPQTRDYVTIVENIWQIDSDVQVIICADESGDLQDIITRIGISERLLIIKKPFEDVEVYQMVVALSRKWDLIQQARIKKEQLEDLVSERTSRLAEMNHRLIFALDKVKRSEQAKDFFLDNISSVVRTPLNSIIVNTNLLVKEGLPIQVQRRLKTVHDNANELMKVISNILDMAEVTSSNIQPNITGVRLKNVIGEMKIFELQAKEKGLKFAINCADRIPEHIYTDSDMLKQCLVILVDNAIKYTDSGSVEINLLLEEGQIRPSLVFEVKDSGCGIEPQRQSEIFNPFSADSASAGLGIGLAIARRVAKSLNGEIDLVATSTYGTTFHLKLPLS